MLNAFDELFHKKYVKNVNYSGKKFEVHIRDSFIGVKGLWHVKIWENKKGFLAPSDIDFATRENPLECAISTIKEFCEKEKQYLKICKELEEVQDVN